MKHTVAFDAAYGGERMRAFLFLPKTRIAAVPDRHLLSGGGRISSAIEPRHVAGLGGLHHPERTSVPLPGVQGDVRAGDVRRDGTERRARAPDRVVERSRTRHRLSRNAIGHRSGSSGVLRRERRRRCRCDPDRSRAALEDQRASGDRDLGTTRRPKSIALNYAPRVRMPTLMLNGRYDFERAIRDGATSTVRPAGNSGRAQTAHGLRDRSRVADRGRGRRDSPLARPLSWTGFTTTTGLLTGDQEFCFFKNESPDLLNSCSTACVRSSLPAWPVRSGPR